MRFFISLQNGSVMVLARVVAWLLAKMKLVCEAASFTQ